MRAYDAEQERVSQMLLHHQAQPLTMELPPIRDPQIVLTIARDHARDAATRAALELKKQQQLQLASNATLHPQAITFAVDTAKQHTTNIAKAASATAKRLRDTDTEQHRLEVHIDTVLPNQTALCAHIVVGGASTKSKRKAKKPKSSVAPKPTVGVANTTATPRSTQLYTDHRQHPTDKYGCHHFGLECFRSMDRCERSAYALPNQFLWGKSCTICNTAVADMPSVGALKQCVYYCNNDLQAFSMDPTATATVTMACQVIICASCHKVKIAALDMDRAVEQEATGVSQTANTRRGTRARNA